MAPIDKNLDCSRFLSVCYIKYSEQNIFQPMFCDPGISDPGSWPFSSNPNHDLFVIEK